MMRTVVLLCALVDVCFGSALLPLFVDPRIIGGTKADITEHPYQLSLQTDHHLCGASIISSKWAITAAHCVGLDPSWFTVRAGSSYHNLGTIYTVKNIIPHPNYNSFSSDYDVALIQIDGEFVFDHTTQPIELTTQEPPAGLMMNVTGWGATTEGGWLVWHLMKVDIPIIDKNQCKEFYGVKNTELTDRMICAGYTEGGKDSCQGDSGGPMASDGVLYGIVSWGFGCARPGFPGVYTNIANLRYWIREISGV